MISHIFTFQKKGDFMPTEISRDLQKNIDLNKNSTGPLSLQCYFYYVMGDCQQPPFDSLFLL